MKIILQGNEKIIWSHCITLHYIALHCITEDEHFWNRHYFKKYLNKLETSKDALWKRKNFNTENWKPCTLDLSPCGKRNAEKSRLGHLWIVFYKSYPTLFALSHPFKPLVDYRLLSSQYNTGKTLEPACQRGLLLALKISIFGQLCLFPTGRIWSCAAMKSQIYI